MHPKTCRILLCAVVVVFASLAVLGQGAKVATDNRPQSESERDHPQERAKWFLRGRTVDGRPATRELHRAHQQKRENRRLHSVGGKMTARQSSVSSDATVLGASAPTPNFVQSVGGPSWIPLGPAPTATVAFGSNQQDYGPAVGRATAVAVDQSDPSGNTVYVGGASGGLWKAINAGAASPRVCNGNGVCTATPTWKPLIDDRETLTVGSIALQPGNSSVILVGTGEANNSADSYYGLGILRSSDGGANWNLISCTGAIQTTPCPVGTTSFHGLGFTHIAFSTDNPNVVVATAAAASGGITVGAETGGADARGIYYSLDAGQIWSRASVFDAAGASPSPGSANAVVYNSAEHRFYANIRYHGFYVSNDGITFNRLGSSLAPGTSQPGDALLSLSACPSATVNTCPLYRAEMAVVPGRNEMYVWIVQADTTGGSNDRDRGIYQTLNGGASWTAISTSGIDSCGDVSGGCGTGTTSQAAYNMTLGAIPNGSATDLYAGGVNEYKCSIDSTLNPTCAAKPFANLTHVYGCSPIGSFAHVHPDEHGIDFSVANPNVVYFANDGGIYRTLNSFSTQQRTCNAVSQPSIPFDNLNASMGSMTQFVWFSQHPTDATTLLGGTQDNGSPAVSGTAGPSPGNWLSVNNGDGGFNDINPLSPSEWFTSNPAPFTAGSGIFRCTSGIGCTNVTFGNPVIEQTDLGGDNSLFYTNFMLDPQATGAVPGAGRMIVGTCRVWRGNSDGSGTDWSVVGKGGNPLSYNFDSLAPDACADNAVNMVTALAAGGPCNGTACNSTPANPSGGGSQVVWAGTDGVADLTASAQRCPNHLPCGGQVWVTTNADGGPSTWARVDGAGLPACTATAAACNINPRNYPISGIAVDPHDATGRTAYVTVMGFGVGHVFKTANAGASWALLDGVAGGLGLPDNPADAVIVDPVTANLVYVATDVGVFSSSGNGVWTELGPSSGAGALPNVATTALHIFNSGGQMKLRVSTYGRGIWEIPISSAPGFTLTVSNATLQAFPTQTVTYTGTLSTYNGYSNSITLSCSGVTPGTCTPVFTSSGSATVTTPGAIENFTVAVANPVVADFNFNIHVAGSEVPPFLQDALVTLHVGDFRLSAPPPATVGAGNTASVAFSVIPQGSFTGNVSLSCSGQPAGTSCNFSPSTATVVAGTFAPAVILRIPTTAATATGVYSVTITGTGAGGFAHSTILTLTVNPESSSISVTNVGNLTFSDGTTGFAKPGQQLKATVQLSAGAGWTGTQIVLGCFFSGNVGSTSCGFGDASPGTSPLAVALTGGNSVQQTLWVDTRGAVAGNPQVTVTARDVPNQADASAPPLNYSIIDYSFIASAPAALVPGGSVGIDLSLAGLNGFSSTVAVTCNADPPLTCSLSPAGPNFNLVTGTAIGVTATIAAPTGTTAKSYAVNINSHDNSFTTLQHNQPVTVSVQDYQISATPTSNTIKAGASSTHTVSITGLGGFATTVNLAVSSGCPQLSTCSFAQSSVAAGGSATLTITTTAASVAGVRPAPGGRGAPLYALWLAMPGLGIVVMVAGEGRDRRRSRVMAGVGLAIAVAVLLMLPACGGGGGSSTTTPPIPKPGTPAGTYTVTVSGTSGSGSTTLKHDAIITLTVQ